MRVILLLVFLGQLTTSERAFTANDDSIHLPGPAPVEEPLPPEDE